MPQIIHNDVGWAKDLVAAAVPTPGDLEDDMVGLYGVVPHHNGLVPFGIEGPAHVLYCLYAVAAEQLPQLAQRHLRNVPGLLVAKGAFEIVSNGQQVVDERIPSCRSLSLGVPPSTLPEVLEVGRETQVLIPLCGKIGPEYDRIRRRARGWNGRVVRL